MIKNFETWKEKKKLCFSLFPSISFFPPYLFFIRVDMSSAEATLALEVRYLGGGGGDGAEETHLEHKHDLVSTLSGPGHDSREQSRTYL